jgi:hypothetical protein
MGIEEEIQTKGIGNLFNKITAENFPNLERGTSRYRKLTEHQTIRTKKGKNTPRHNIIKTLNYTEQRKSPESYKREKISHL